MEKNYIDGQWVYDEETYPNCYTMTIIRADGQYLRQYEISDRKNGFICKTNRSPIRII